MKHGSLLLEPNSKTAKYSFSTVNKNGAYDQQSITINFQIRVDRNIFSKKTTSQHKNDFSIPNINVEELGTCVTGERHKSNHLLNRYNLRQ